MSEGTERAGRQEVVVAAEELGSPAAVTGTAHAGLAARLAGQVAEALWLPGGLEAAEQAARVGAALAALRGLAPRAELEGMLGVQMVAVHGAAMECLRRAAQADASGRAAELRQAGRLIALYAKQVEALNRHRGRGSQTVTVEHVQVRGGKTVMRQINQERR